MNNLPDAINFGLDIQENFHLLSGKWFSELKRKYSCLQVGNKYSFPDKSSCHWDNESNSFVIDHD